MALTSRGSDGLHPPVHSGEGFPKALQPGGDSYGMALRRLGFGQGPYHALGSAEFGSGYHMKNSHGSLEGLLSNKAFIARTVTSREWRFRTVAALASAKRERSASASSTTESSSFSSGILYNW